MLNKKDCGKRNIEKSSIENVVGVERKIKGNGPNFSWPFLKILL